MVCMLGCFFFIKADYQNSIFLDKYPRRPDNTHRKIHNAWFECHSSWYSKIQSPLYKLSCPQLHQRLSVEYLKTRHKTRNTYTFYFLWWLSIRIKHLGKMIYHSAIQDKGFHNSEETDIASTWRHSLDTISEWCSDHKSRCYCVDSFQILHKAQKMKTSLLLHTDLKILWSVTCNVFLNVHTKSMHILL